MAESIIAEIHLLTRKVDTLKSNYVYIDQLVRSEKGFRIVRSNVSKTVLSSMHLPINFLKEAPISFLMAHAATIGKASIVLDAVFEDEKVLHKIERILTNEGISFKIARRKK